MKFYAIHNKEYWDSQKDKEFLESNKDFYEFPEQYEWLIGKMKEKMPNYTGEYLLWLWVQKPELYDFPYYDKPTEMVLLEVELDEKDVLISDYDSWDMYVTENREVPDMSEDTEDEFPEMSLDDIKKSWDRIFDLDWCINNPNIHTNVEEYTVFHQATTDRIPIKNIKVVKEFISITTEELYNMD